MLKALAKFLLLFVLLSIIPACNFQRENIWYVAMDGNDNNSCRAQANACRTIQVAIEIEARLFAWVSDGSICQAGGLGIGGFHQFFVEIAADLPAQVLGTFKDIFCP